MRLAALLLCIPALHAADPKWFRTPPGPVELVSDAPPKVALETLGTLEEFRSAVGQSFGKPDMATYPPVTLLIRRASALPATFVVGRNRFILPLAPEQPITPAILRAYTKLLFDQNVNGMPEGVAAGLETFFSTVQVKGVHVIWGGTPPPSERTLAWARIHLIATSPAYYGKLRVLLGNLQNGIDEDVALRNSIGKGSKEFAAEASAYLARGVFPTADAPSRPLNAQRDFKMEPMLPEAVQLAQADLLDDASAATYRTLMKRHAAEAYEGLAMLARRRNDEESARDFITRSIDAESKSGWVWLEYARFGPDRPESVARALEIDPNNAEAHYMAATQKDDIDQAKAATRLSPRTVLYWDFLAQLYLGQKKYSEAAKAWRSGELAATDPAERERMHTAWSGIEQRRFNAIDADKKQQADSLEALKAKSAAELHAAEDRINGKTAAASTEKVMEWDDVMPHHLEGTLLRVECNGKQTRVAIEDSAKKQILLLVRNRGSLVCGPGAARHVSLDFTPKPNAKLGTAGEIESLPE